MDPPPIAVLALFYSLIATLSAAMVWRIVSETSHRSLPWAVGWLVLSAAVMCGLPLLRPWARRLAILGSTLLLVMMLAIACRLVASAQPGWGLAAALGAGVHVLIIRYLRRPSVRASFSSHAAQWPRGPVDAA